MEAVEERHVWRLERIPTGVPNLDRVTDGGLSRGSLVLIVGEPGTGKTVLAEQMAFHWASHGENVLWLAMLGEPNEKLLVHLSEMSFFDRRLVGASLQLVNLTRYLRQSLEEKLAAIRQTIRSGSYAYVVIDGFKNLLSFLNDEQEARFFLSELSAELALAGITLLLTAEVGPERYWQEPEFALADCIIVLDQAAIDGREQRRLEVTKLRGRPAIGGLHTFAIDNRGVSVHPRSEAVLPRGRAAVSNRRESFGVRGLDHLLDGGVLEGTTTVLAGAVGTGKSALTACFLGAGIRAGQACLQMCFFEDVAHCLQRSDALGLPLRAAYEAGQLRIAVYDPASWDPDSCAEDFVDAIERRGIRRVAIDGIDPIERYLDASGRSFEFMSAFVQYMRLRGVTALVTYEMRELLSAAVSLPSRAVADVAGNLILLRYGEVEDRLRRFLTVVKTRYAAHSSQIAELLIEEGAVNVVAHPGVRETALAEVAYGAQPGLHQGERLRP